MRHIFGLGSALKTLASVFALAAALVYAPPAQANLASLTFSGATWFGGGTLSGTFSYIYDPNTGDISSLVSGDVVTTTGVYNGLEYFFNIPNSSNNVVHASFQNNNPQGYYLVHFDNNSQQINLDLQGIGNSMSLIVQTPNQTPTCESAGGNGCRTLSSAGTSVAYDATIPEPASLALLGVALAGLGVARRRLNA